MTALIEETFYQELLTKLLSQYPMQISFPTLQQNPAQLVELRCFQALRQIKEIISEPTLSDAECFQRIDAIVCVLEKLDSDGGAQHDFL